MSEYQNGNGQDQSAGPVRKLRNGALSASIFRHDTPDGPIFNTEVTRSWKDQNGEWQNSSSFSEYELPKVAELTMNARDVIVGLRHEQSLIRDGEAQMQSQVQTPVRNETNSTPAHDTAQEAYKSRRAQSDGHSAQPHARRREAPRER